MVIWFLDEASSDFSNYVRKKQSLKLEVYMYGLLHSKAVKLDLINFENPEYFDCLTRASREAPWRPNSILNNLVSLLRGSLSLIINGRTNLHSSLDTCCTPSCRKYSGNLVTTSLCRISFIIFRGSRPLKQENQHISTGSLQVTDLQGN